MKTPRFLLVDDDRSIINLILAQLAFTRITCEISAIQSLQDLDGAVEELRTVDVLIVDVNLGDQDGFFVHGILKRRFPKMQTLFISGMPVETFSEPLGERAFLAKPFSATDLHEKINELLQKGFYEAEDEPESLPSTSESEAPIQFGRELHGTSGFRGLVSDFRLFDIIQLYILGHQTGRLLLRSSKFNGWVHLDKGHVVDAMVGVLHGETALFKLLTIDAGEFIFVSGGAPDRITIEKRWEELSLSAVREMDEQLSLE